MNVNSEQNAQRNLIYNIAQFFRDHPAIFITVLYGYISAVGVLYMWILYRQFGINVIDFAETNDFLLAAFKEPLALAMALVSTITAVLFILRWTSRRRRTSRVRRIHYIVMFSFMLVYTFFPPLYFGRIRAIKIKYGEGKNVIVELRAKTMDIGDEIFLLGTTEKFAFFYNYTKERTHIVPIANILNIYNVAADSTEVSSPKNNNSDKSKP